MLKPVDFLQTQFYRTTVQHTDDRATRTGTEVDGKVGNRHCAKSLLAQRRFLQTTVPDIVNKYSRHVIREC